MKYGILEDFKIYMIDTTHLRPNTAKIYYNKIDNLLEGQSLINTIEKFEIEKVMNNLSKIKYKNEFSQSKNALMYFLEFANIPLDERFSGQINILERMTNKRYRKLKGADLKEIEQTINYLKNNKMKLSYQILLSTGLRVNELSQIRKNDCTISDKDISFDFIGKGGRKEKSKITKEENNKLFETVKKLIESTGDESKVFYSANYLQQKSKEYGFQCHDLRRAFARMQYKKGKSKKEVQKELRHSDEKTTDIYLKSKIKIE